MATPPALDSRSYQELVDDAIARIPIHNPEWTNFNASDPGVTLLQLFAFLSESAIYTANQVPERNRARFLELLGVPRAGASSARGVVTVSNAHGPPEPVTLSAGFEVRAGEVPFAADRGLQVLPVEAAVYVKQVLSDPSDRLLVYHRQLYASYDTPVPPPAELRLYETVPLDPLAPAGVTLADTADGSLWIALLLRQGKDPKSGAARAAARQALAASTLSIGLVPVVAVPERTLGTIGAVVEAPGDQVSFQLPLAPAGGLLPPPPAPRPAHYRTLDARFLVDVLTEPGVVELTLPDAAALQPWTNLDPLEAGVGDFPPPLEDPVVAERLVTWVRVRAAAGSQAAFQWAAINATTVSQRVRVANEAPPAGNGEPDQVVELAHSSLIPGSVTLAVGEPPAPWEPIDDLIAAGPEVPVPDLRLAPGVPQPPPAPANVFVVEHADGRLRFGDGARGARPVGPLRVSYDYGLGAAGNVGPGAIASAPGLPSGVTVTNPVRTWGGAEAETADAAAKQASRYLQHRDRLVTLEDFETILWRTPGVELGRIDALPAFNPNLVPNAPGDAPGAVTVMVVPARDPLHPDAPQPGRPFLDAVCAFADARRLVTTEVFVRGPVYRGIWISVGVDVLPGLAAADVTDAVRAELKRFLAPVDPTAPPWYAQAPRSVDAPYVHATRGWPLRKAIVALELVAVASRVAGVDYVRGLAIAEGASAANDRIELSGLELPQILGIQVVPGDPPDIDAVRGLQPPEPPPTTTLPVPAVPETC
jgi:hypothetical protein